MFSMRSFIAATPETQQIMLAEFEREKSRRLVNQAAEMLKEAAALNDSADKRLQGIAES